MATFICTQNVGISILENEILCILIAGVMFSQEIV